MRLVRRNWHTWVVCCLMLLLAFAGGLAVLRRAEKRSEAPTTPAGHAERRGPLTLMRRTPDEGATVEMRARRAGEPHKPPPVPECIPSPAPPRWGWASAELHIGQRVVQPENRFGRFQPVRVAPEENVWLRIHWPSASPGTVVAVEVVDGGRLDGNILSRLLEVDETGAVEFEYRTNDYPGRCQLVLRRGFDETRLMFWVTTGDFDADGPLI